MSAPSTPPSVTMDNVSTTPADSDVNVTWALQPQKMNMSALVNLLLPLQYMRCNFINIYAAFTKWKTVS